MARHARQPLVSGGPASRPFPGPWLAWLALGLAATLLAARFWDHTSDDAYISFRYARNLVEGHGLVFNPGERVEGYTNFLWVMIAALPLALGRDPVAWTRVVGLLATLASLWGVGRAAGRLTGRPLLAGAAALLLALSPSAAVWAAAGLETPLFAALVLWSVWLVAEALEAGRHPPAPAAVLLGAAALTRPEGLLVAALVLAATAPLAARRDGVLAWLRFAGVVALVVGPWLVWRALYYGDLLPNTFHAKVGLSSAQAWRGFVYGLEFLVECGSWTLAAVGLGLVLLRRRPACRLMLAVVVPYLAYVVVIGGDALPMYRFFVPMLGLLAILLAAGVAAFIARRPGEAARPPWVAAVPLAAWALVCVWPAFAGGSYRFVEQDRREVATWRAIGLWFEGHALPGQSIALVPAGAIPYYSRLPAIDMLGLTDRTVARHAVPAIGSQPAGHERSDAAYVLSRRPTFILLGTYALSPGRPDAAAALPLYYRAEREITEAPGLESDYRVRFGHPPGGYFTYLSLRDVTLPE
jgi:arabinofuranosyltransferase